MTEAKKPARLEFDVAVMQGSLYHLGGVTVPYDLLFALRSLAADCKVTEVTGTSKEEVAQQAALFAAELRAIWANAEAADTTGNYMLSDNYEPTGGARPPWKKGSGAMFSIGMKAPTGEEAWLHKFDNAEADPKQSVHVKFLVSLQFTLA